MPSELPPPPPGPDGHRSGPPSAPTDTAEGATTAGTPRRRLHPVSIVRDVSPGQLVQGLVPAVIALAQFDVALPALVAILLLLVAGYRVLAWTRHTYEVTDGRVVDRSGVVSRSERTLDVDRVQQVEVTRTLLDRFLGTAEVRLETASDGGESELTLRVVEEAEADRLARELRPRGRPVRDADTSRSAADLPPPASRRTLVEVPTTHLAIAAVTGRRLLVVPVAIGVLLSQGEVVEFVRRRSDEVVDTAAGAGVTAVVLLGVLLLVLSVAFAAVTGIVVDHGLTITDDGQSLRVSRGLLTERRAAVPRARVQRVSISTNGVRRALGYAALVVHSAGGGGGGDGAPGDDDRQLRVPLLPLGDADALARDLLGTDHLPDLTNHPLPARRRAVFRSLGAALLLAVPALGLVAWLGPPAALLAPALLVAAVPVGRQRYRRLGSGTSPALVASRSGLLGWDVEVAPRRKVQGTRVRSTPFQRRRALASLAVDVAGPGGGLTLVDVAADRARDLGDELTRGDAPLTQRAPVTER